jgi:hypothetical protein
MACDKLFYPKAVAFILLGTIRCAAQAPAEDHSCTLNAAGGFAAPFGKDGSNFNTGGIGFQAGGGFAVTPSVKPLKGVVLFLTANYAYDRLQATAAALLEAQKAGPTQLTGATSAHGSFSAVTFDPTLRYPLTRRTSLYLSGGFGWFRREVSFNGANPGALLAPGSVSLDRAATNSGAIDAGGGVNFGLTPRGGVMFYAEARIYRGLAVNSGTTLVPLSFGVRW